MLSMSASHFQNKPLWLINNSAKKMDGVREENRNTCWMGLGVKISSKNGNVKVPSC